MPEHDEDSPLLLLAMPAFAADVECRSDLGMMESQFDWNSLAGAALRQCSNMQEDELLKHALANKSAPYQKAAIREGMFANDGKALHSGRRRWAQALALCGAFSSENAGMEAAQTLGRWLAKRHPDFNEPGPARPLRQEIDQAKRDCSLEAIGFGEPERKLQEQIGVFWTPTRAQSNKEGMLEKARAIIEQASLSLVAAKPGASFAGKPRI